MQALINGILYLSAIIAVFGFNIANIMDFSNFLKESFPIQNRLIILLR
jgi:hypothetical protein